MLLTTWEVSDPQLPEPSFAPRVTSFTLKHPPLTSPSLTSLRLSSGKRRPGARRTSDNPASSSVSLEKATRWSTAQRLSTTRSTRSGPLWITSQRPSRRKFPRPFCSSRLFKLHRCLTSGNRPRARLLTIRRKANRPRKACQQQIRKKRPSIWK